MTAVSDVEGAAVGRRSTRRSTGDGSPDVTSAGSIGTEPAPSGFRPAARRRNRIAAGVALGALAIGGNVLIYSSLDDSESVLQVVRDIPAGEVIAADALRSVDADVDDTVDVVAADDIAMVVGQYARVRLIAGSLLTDNALQAAPLVAPGSSVVAIQVPEGSLPIGLRERVPMELVIPAPGGGGADVGSPTVIPGRVVGLPSETTSVTGQQSLSVEVSAADAPTVAAADDVRVVLSEPAADPADADGVETSTAEPVEDP
jgi:hypothetical protein